MNLSLLAKKTLALAVCLSLCWSASAAEIARTVPANAPVAAPLAQFHQELTLSVNAFIPQTGAVSLDLPALQQLRADASRLGPDQDPARQQAAAFLARMVKLEPAQAKAELERAGVAGETAERVLAASAAAKTRAPGDAEYARALSVVDKLLPKSKDGSLMQRVKRVAAALTGGRVGAQLALDGANGAPSPRQSGPSGSFAELSASPLAADAAPAAQGAVFVPTSKKVSELLRLQKADPEAAFAMADGMLSDKTEPRVEVRAAALRALKGFAAERSAPIYIRVASDASNWYIQRMAAQLIGQNASALGGQKDAAEKALREAYKNSNPSVRLMAKWSLEQMGLDAGPEPKAFLVDVIRGRVPAMPQRQIQSNNQGPAPRKPSLLKPMLWMLGMFLAFKLFIAPMMMPQAPVHPAVDNRPAITQTLKAEDLKTGDDALKSIAKSVDEQTQILKQQEADRQAEIKKRKEEAAKSSGGSMMFGIILQLAMAILPIFLLVWLMRKMMGGGGGIGAAGQFSKAKTTVEKPNVRFTDVAGIDDAMQDVQQIIDYLKNPQAYTKLGGRLPKGTLLVGPPGTGKTLLARAVAGEANANFISVSASTFVEMFVGVGASRVRDLFNEARANAPTILFIDEIDAIGKARGGAGGMGGGNDEREQTLNQILTELDGFIKSENVIVMAATNRVDVLDPALTRPGRFDRKIFVGNPDVLGREAILAVHGAKVRLGPDVDLEFAARRTPGIAGAGLANIINEAALLSGREHLDAINSENTQRAIDKETFGDRRHLFLDAKTKERVAYHEAGHALAGMLAGEADGKAPNKITIIPHGDAALGYAEPAQEGDGADSYLLTQDQLEARIIGAMGGRAAEEIMYPGKKGISTGPGSDIQDHADRIARMMVTKLGMSEKVGIIDAGRNEYGQSKVSEATAQMVDEEVRRITAWALSEAKRLLTANKDKLEAVVKVLKERETIYGPEIEEIVRGKKQP